jgi:hypothetical protein
MAGITNLQKKNKMFPIKWIWQILVWGLPNGFFVPGPTKISSCPPTSRKLLQLLENIPEYTKENKIKSKLKQ